MDIIIGAGITGLTYANFTKHPFVILEADDHTGGLCNTINQDGFTWDYSGHFFHFRDEAVAKFINERINQSGLVKVYKHTQIRYKNKWIDFPFQKNIHQLPKKEFIECLCDLFSAPKAETGSFKSMLYEKFGKAIAEKFLIPYNTKLYATDLNNLDSDAMGRFFPYANKEEIISNFKATKSASYNDTFLYHKGGAIQYVKALERDVQLDKIYINEKVISIDCKRKVVVTDHRELCYDNLISTIALPSLLTLCGMKYDDKVLTWNKVLVFNLGFDKPGADRKNHWIYFPEKKYCFYRVGFYSNIISADRMSLYVEISFKPNEAINVEEMLQKTLHGLRTAGILQDEQLVSWHYVIMNPAYVHVSHRGTQFVQDTKKLLADSNVYTIGRYGSWNYSSIEDNMKEAIELTKMLS